MPDTPTRITFDGRDSWLFPDGTTVPVVSGADDDGAPDVGELGGASPLEATLAAIDAGEAGDGAPEVGAGSAATGASTAVGGEGDAPRTVAWDEHVALRRENAGYRQKYQPFEQAFGSLDPEVSGALLEVAKMYASDPEAAAARLAEALGVEMPAGEPGPVTEESVRAAVQNELGSFFEQQQQSALQQRQLSEARESIKETARGLGYEPGSKPYNRLLMIARDEFATDEFGDPRAPVDAVKLAASAIAEDFDAMKKATVAEYLKGKDEGGGISAVGSGDAPTTETPIKDLADSRRGFAAALGAS